MLKEAQTRGPQIVAGQPHGPAAIITRRAADRLRAGHLWVYSSDVTSLIPHSDNSEIPPGALVTVADSRGIPLGTALYSSASQLTLRIVSIEAPLTRSVYLDHLRKRARTALTLRDELAASSSTDNSCRLIFSEA